MHGGCDCLLKNKLSVLKILKDEYHETIKLTTFECGILKTTLYNESYKADKVLRDYEFLMALSNLGYFHDINMSLTVIQALNRAQVIVDDD